MTVRRAITLATFLLMVGACGYQPPIPGPPTTRGPASVSLLPAGATAVPCPTDGTEFAYGTCALPAGVGPADDIARVGAPSAIVTPPCGRGTPVPMVLPFGYDFTSVGAGTSCY